MTTTLSAAKAASAAAVQKPKNRYFIRISREAVARVCLVTTTVHPEAAR